MPIIVGAKKALRQSKKRYLLNSKKRLALKNLIKKFIKSKAKDDLSLLYSAADKAVKSGIIHKNKAKRIKSKLARL
ncbi:30S ribosomal protein S20 [Candidatus Shapirobacteria bacterium CG03_land_8_20_14_0_80_40_19]|uniref:Small ribosomal subunit protein bS20 n=4 Tax=Candidatus Shapironibacteriota TaxID=1752721 RepID=A0A2M7BG20_9BACT|nr:MAG: 30S ribosomal protein S20 [Candidatus Shapirobacteria bacterium CG11_big_fil_rev_8_21_14_0_20_40_12]PIV02029.1 MAG: 30S ribosomal protein S20 [Candidatus Shapirobacteria bacterium CG03_land_8_20_14_0_80_40_19]PJC29260.1 MAG: 30S ribosomal protein S20 [Candidatus Shapirobacteria bacterium CG_4_9_14_0_2_um_filter_40_11]PJC76193.1 MAG: 30S ribosomal protein S20 [Candidatus Shapirobacteria bacterium CG_4_8_14_3_um_filter_39_11]